MKVLDPGHDYLLDVVDGDEPIRLTFVKRDNPPERYPGNEGHYAGTQFQEVLRALIDRGVYVNAQSRCPETTAAIDHFRHALYLFEARVRRVRGQPGLEVELNQVENYIPCKECGHIECLLHGPGKVSGGGL